MQAEERQQRIEEHLQKVEFASLDELAELVDVSVSTIRRDLDALEQTGSVRRTHGGARLAAPRSEEWVFSARDTHQVEEKEAIGAAAAGLIAPGQTVILDAGTTVYHIAKHLTDKKPQIITNSLPVANLLAGENAVEVVVTGGVVYHRLGVLMGPPAVEAFAKIHADVAVMSSSGITLEGVTNSHGLLIEIQREMLRAAQKVLLCMDHTKLGRKSMSPLCGLDEIDVLVTDSRAPAEIVEAFRARGLDVLLAPPSSSSANGK
ncbi:MAG: DeoR/GlpR transcriptional regulator [Verrucomicrobiae bacterium]|nr:DeoR/GlpR transcriptional regulator [Verrucomicrobiae bacterium]